MECTTCDGTGKLPGYRDEVCSHCKGTGKMSIVELIFWILVIVTVLAGVFWVALIWFPAVG